MSSDDPKLKWMYDGPKADVHREDFLLGKQLTKDFELYSDVARKDADAEKSEAIDKSFIKSVTHSSNRNNKVSALGLDVVMHEDPLVAIKTKAELRKREIYDNPAIQMNLRKALMEEYQHDKEKKEKKKAKKEKKRKRKESKSERDSRHYEERKHKRRDYSDDDEESYQRHRMNMKRRYSEEERKRHQVSSSSSTSSPDDSPLPPRRSTCDKVDNKKAEMERKRQKMLENASWRNEHRKETIEKTHEMLKKELEDSQAHAESGPSFIRPMLQSAVDGRTLEDSVNARRKRAAGSSRDMQKSFARR